MNQNDYCINIFNYQRLKTSEVEVGIFKIGGDNPIVVQSMTTTNTNDVKATIDQIKRIADAGGELVRMTTQGKKEAENLKWIKQGLTEVGYKVPLVADIHFNPAAANEAAKHVEKVRINPGNFVDGAKRFEEIEYTNESYLEELEEVRRKLVPFIKVCKQNNTAIRIGTNHGSLSDRIMSRYGDTPEGMVESCMEFLRICREEKFFNIVLSIKASNARIMVHTVRLLVQKMHEENMSFPLHLGVTEAGEGKDGRIRSAVGIGTLLVDGIGDTIRVSLTEEPENEIPVAKKLIEYISAKEGHERIKPLTNISYSPFKYEKQPTIELENVGGNQQPVVISSHPANAEGGMMPDYIYQNEVLDRKIETPIILPYDKWMNLIEKRGYHPIIDVDKLIEKGGGFEGMCFVKISYPQMDERVADSLKEYDNIILVLESDNKNNVAEQRAAFLWLSNQGIKVPVVIKKSYVGDFNGEKQLEAACDIGPLFIDGFGDGIWVEGESDSCNLIETTMFSILQAARVRFSRPDYISCPGCGRTLFGLQETTANVKSKTSHLKGLKIAIMGCIVNGPGEMADADYGYVGSGPGKITLYHQRKVVKRNVEEKEAVDELIALIKQNGDWFEPA